METNKHKIMIQSMIILEIENIRYSTWYKESSDRIRSLFEEQLDDVKNYFGYANFNDFIR